MNWSAALFVGAGILIIVVGFRNTFPNILSTFGAAPATTVAPGVNVCTGIVNGKTVSGTKRNCVPGFCNVTSDSTHSTCVPATS